AWLGTRHPALSLTTSSCSDGCGRCPTNSPGWSFLWDEIAGQLLVQHGLGEQFTEQRSEFHQVAADERDDAAAAGYRPAIPTGVEPGGAGRDTVHPANGGQCWEQRAYGRGVWHFLPEGPAARAAQRQPIALGCGQARGAGRVG